MLGFSQSKIVLLIAALGLASSAGTTTMQDVPIYYPTLDSASHRQLAFNQAAPKFNATVFAAYRDFQEEILTKKPLTAIAPTSFGRYFPDYEAIFTLGNDSLMENYVILALSARWTDETLGQARIGAVAETSQSNFKSLVRHLTGSDFPECKSVPKIDDLLPLLVFKAVDVIIMAAREYEKLKKQGVPATLREVTLKSPLRSGGPQVFVRKSALSSNFVQPWRQLSANALAQLGFRQIREVKQPTPRAKVAVGDKDSNAIKEKPPALQRGAPVQTEVHRVSIAAREHPTFDIVRNELTRLLREEHFAVSGLADDTYDTFASALAKAPPTTLALFDNKFLDNAIRYNRAQPAVKDRLRGVALLGLNLPAMLANNEDFTGIAYEVPGYILIRRFRALVNRPVRNVLVYYRASIFSERIAQTREQLAAEGITLHAKDVEVHGENQEDIEKFLAANLANDSRNTQSYDVFWVMLDSYLINQKTFGEYWQPAAKRARIPFITETDQLAQADFDFATYAVSPDLLSMAAQASQMIQAIAEQPMARKPEIESLVSVNEFLNLRKAKQLGLAVDSGRLGDITVFQ